MKSYSFVTSRIRRSPSPSADQNDGAPISADGHDKRVVPVIPVVLAAVLATLVFGVSGSSAQTFDEVRLVRPASDPVAVIESDLAVAELTIDVLEQQLASVRQSALTAQDRIETQRATILAMRQSAVLSASIDSVDTGFEQWQVGYDLGGGAHHAAFENVILPCESGSEPDPDRAIGPTDDWGRAQVNRPTWSVRFEELTGLAFEEHILDPVLNGYMAAVIEQEHFGGLNAWTCWRKR